MKKIAGLLLLVMLIAHTGCGPKVSDVFKKYEGDFAKKREQFKAIAGALPSQGNRNAVKQCTEISPPIEFNEKTRTYNTEMVMFENLSDPDAKPKMDIAPNGELLNAIQWTGPKNPMSSTVLDERAGDMESRLKAALDYRYLVVNRVADLRDPVAMDEKTYMPGQVRIETFVVDLKDNTPVCSFTIEAQSASTVSYSYKSDQSKQEQLEKFAHSTMWEDARKKLIAGLQKAGAKIELN
ncbi:MAG: hypothetical protein JO360_16225 [Acidobacteria bacterium]|nr:hypothetical protein [Acidobacteriota bacterium]